MSKFNPFKMADLVSSSLEHLSKRIHAFHLLLKHYTIYIFFFLVQFDETFLFLFLNRVMKF